MGSDSRGSGPRHAVNEFIDSVLKLRLLDLDVGDYSFTFIDIVGLGFEGRFEAGEAGREGGCEVCNHSCLNSVQECFDSVCFVIAVLEAGRTLQEVGCWRHIV